MANIGWDAGQTYTAQVLAPQNDAQQRSLDNIQEAFFSFIQHFHINGVYIYRCVKTLDGVQLG